MGKMLPMAKTEPSRVYDVLFAEASRVLERYNPCEWEDGTCRAMRSGYYPDGCCTGPRCEHLTEKGCGVQSLGCRVWLCGDVRQDKKNAPVIAALNVIDNLRWRLLPPNSGVRKSKEQVLGA